MGEIDLVAIACVDEVDDALNASFVTGLAPVTYGLGERILGERCLRKCVVRN